MKLDLVEINRLSPPSLWQLAPIRALIETLLVVIKSKSGGQFTGLYKRMLVQQSKSLREKIRENLNMRIKAWILQCPARIAWVRSIIGEAAIRRWRMNRLADYALTKYFGDWKSKWPNGFKNKVQQTKQMQKPSIQHAIRDYAWKPFALVKIVNVRGFLYGRPAPKTDTAHKPKWSQPRTVRTLKPIRFTPSELDVDAAVEREETSMQDGEHPNEKLESTGVKKLHAPPDSEFQEKEFEENNLAIEEKKPP